MRNSASGMFVQCNILSFGELLRKSIFAFRGRIQSSNNTVITFMVNSVAPLVSNVSHGLLVVFLRNLVTGITPV